ncbi:MAG TPA: S41 family peptidase, partial [Thermodesulfobacteriota bacterium]|nr:S41 family peptidase [Thermodesulfobacteriota bacterium]
MSNWKSKRKLFAVASLFFFLGIYLGLTHVRRVGGADVDSAYEKFKILADVFSIVEMNYVEKVKPNQLINGAINGMLETLDPHSNYMPSDVYKEMQSETRGSFGGIGFEITIRDKILTVVAPIEDTPASRAGIQTGDMILKIDGKSTKDMTLVDAVKKMRGPQGTKVSITIMRQGFTEPRDFTLTRAIIPIRSIRSRSLEPGYGYVKISQFIEKTLPDMDAALKKLETQDGALKGLILDLRNNPGGLLDQAVKVSDQFLDSG